MEPDRHADGPGPSHASLCSCSFTGCTSACNFTSSTVGGASPLSRQWSPGSLDTTRPPRPRFASRGKRKAASTDSGDSSNWSSNQSFTGCAMIQPSSAEEVPSDAAMADAEMAAASLVQQSSASSRTAASG